MCLSSSKKSRRLTKRLPDLLISYLPSRKIPTKGEMKQFAVKQLAKILPNLILLDLPWIKVPRKRELEQLIGRIMWV